MSCFLYTPISTKFSSSTHDRIKNLSITDTRFLYSRPLRHHSWCFLIPFKCIQHCHVLNPFYSTFCSGNSHFSQFLLLLLASSSILCWDLFLKRVIPPILTHCYQYFRYFDDEKRGPLKNPPIFLFRHMV